ncbi:MAG: protein-glutamate O-methyltransferase CheR [Pseudomonadota bacterium]
MDKGAVEELEMHMLIQAVRQAYGYDLLRYAEPSLRRRLLHWLGASGFASFSQAQGRVLREPKLFDSLIQGITVNVTEMFRDPPFFAALREHVVPYLRTVPFARIWHAGCSSGEEAYSMAILLHEAGLAGRYRLYATDVNETVLAQARDGIFPSKAMQAATRNYQLAGGSASFGDYYTANYEHAIMAATLREHIVFAPHNLLTDAAFGQMDMVLCRNVMIYFKMPWKEHCIALFDSCLRPGAALCVGIKETLDGKLHGRRYQLLAPRTGIYRKCYE